MSEDLKFIVTELNKILKKNYTLLSLKALNGDDLLQILSDVLSEVTQDGSKVNLRDEALEQTSVRLLSLLRVLKYQPNKDPALFRQRLVKGDPETIYTILQWLLSNVEVARQRAYLARFLVKVIVDRIEKIKVRTESNAHLLKAAQALRVERERERDLASQKVQEREAIGNLQASLQRSERKLHVLREAGEELTPQAVIQRLAEEVMVLTAVRKERLPSELATLKSRVEALSSVAGSSYIGPDDIVAFTVV